MSYPISIGGGGYSGWKLLQRVENQQRERLSRDKTIKQDMSYFRDRIEITDSAEKLVGDRRLLSVALSAFGLGSEINNRVLIRKVLESDLSDRRSLANRFADKRYRKLAEAFDFHRRSKPVVETDDDFKKRVGLGGLDEKNNQISITALFANDTLRNLASQYSEEMKEMRSGGWSKEDIKTYEATLNASLWEKIFSDKSKSTSSKEASGNDFFIKDVIKGAFGFDHKFEKLRDFEKIEEASKALEKLFGSASFAEIGKPENLARLAWEFAYNTQKIVDPAQSPKKTKSDGSTTEAEAEPVAKPTQRDLDKRFIQVVSLGVIDGKKDKKTQEALLEARDGFIELKESTLNDDKLWLKTIDDPHLGKVMREVFRLDKGFDQLTEFLQLAELRETSKRILGAESLKDFAEPKVHERLIAIYIFNDRNSKMADKAASEDSLADRVSDAYLEQEFERRIGLGDQSLRLALNARREFEAMAERPSSDRALWYEVLGNPPLRKVFEGAFGFGQNYARLDIDRQVREFSRASERLLGSSSFKEITKPDNVEKLLRSFFVRGGASSSVQSSRYSAALAIMSQPSYF